MTIPSSLFYNEYHGHKVEHLSVLHRELRDNRAPTTVVWTAGDSSLDNKHWFHDTVDAPPGYDRILAPPRSRPDVTYWMNHLLASVDHTVAINTAVEATTLNERTIRLRPQDIFLRDHLQPQDILVVSIGGNDVALMPCPCTIASMLCLLRCVPASCTANGCTCGTVPLDDCCCGCGPSLASCLCAYPPCLGYLRHLFGTRVERYIQALTSKTKPSKILVCMIYYPSEQPSRGWAGPALASLGYDSQPSRLQSAIRKIFQEATSRIRIQGSEVVPVPLYLALDSKNDADYVERVEPSATGGRKMAEYLINCMGDTITTPAKQRMHDRS